MKSADGKPFVYEKCPLIEVICQLRFPSILSIDTQEPAEFQDKIRDVFPRYHAQTDKVAVQGGEPSNITTHNFITESGDFRLSMTKFFISLSTMRYTSWEQFARTLDEPLGHFISIYRPAFFERVGLRYVNGFSRRVLDLQESRWNDLLEPQYLGVLQNDDIPENQVGKCSVDMELKLDESAHLKLHAGPGRLQRTIRTPEGLKTMQDPDVRFIFDQDLFSTGNIKAPSIMNTLESLHGHADRIFSEAITEVLHDAMDPVEV